MPNKPLGLRPVRESAKRDTSIPKIGLFAFLLSDGTRGLTMEPVARDLGEARAAWPHYRRAVWGNAWEGRIPKAAEVFDNLTMGGIDAAFGCTPYVVFDVAAAVASLEQDRAAVA